ncbi:hypothetical protein [Hyphomicrobium sp. ghe19]|uniref:hypothetical protein n=1 Tax=Hyphomicrobium sp. ghe19 TaxID=2682968 RepID=UPI00136750FE|nr:hypothetical protein HYPP_00304 [Hyphomicrobium sp. ghe19]
MGEHTRSPAAQGGHTYLEYCCREALDAYTLEDALMWQQEISRELTRRIAFVAEADWPTDIKARTLFDLMHRRATHNARARHAETALRKNENLTWRR